MLLHPHPCHGAGCPHPLVLAMIRALLEGCSVPGLGLRLAESLHWVQALRVWLLPGRRDSFWIRCAGQGAEGKGLLCHGSAIVSCLREVFPLLQWAHGSPVRLPERQRLQRLVQGPRPLHRHAGRSSRHGQGLPIPGGVRVFSGGLFVLLPPVIPVPGALLFPQDAFVKIARYEGIRSLWSGLPPTL